MSYYSYTKTEKLLSCEKLHNKINSDFYIVMGFQRSGTSLLGKIINSCDIYLGDKKDLKKAEITNPNGFYEHSSIYKLSWKYLYQSDYSSSRISNIDLHPKNSLQKLQRLFTIKKMHAVLFKLSKKNNRVGIKLFPLFYYLWKEYLPKHKIIAIYRDPYTSVHSYLNVFWPSKTTFEHGLNLWTQAQKDLLYHISQNENLLIKYEDLLDTNKQDEVIEKIIEFVGGGDLNEIKNIINEKLDRKSHEAKRIHEYYPRNKEVEKILEQLDKFKV